MGYCGECDASLSAELSFCPVCGARVDPDSAAASGPLALFAAPADWDPRRPVLSVAASILLLWAAAHTLAAGYAGGVGALFFGTAGVAIVPRVRLAVGRLGGRKPANPGLFELVVLLLIGLYYAVLVAIAVAVLYGAATSDQRHLVPGSRFAVVQAYVVAVVIRRAARVVRSIREA